jgi:hypothetical protein
MTREELIQSIQTTSQDIQNAYLVDKAAKLDSRANEKLQKLSGITGLYDADSPRIPTYTNPLTGKPTNTTRITADDYYVQAPELKDANWQLTQAGINARIQADNYAMGVDAPNFPAGEGLEPQYYQQYVDAMNPAIQERNQAGTYNIADTGSIDKYGRKLVQAQSTEMPMSQTDYLLSKEQGKKVLLQPSNESGLRDYFIQQGSVDSDGYLGNLVDAAQYGIGRLGATAGDAAVDALARLSKEARKMATNETEEELNTKFAKDVKGSLWENWFDNKGNFTALDKYKEAKEYGYDDSRIQEYTTEFKDVMSDENSSILDKMLVVGKAVQHFPEVLAGSSGDIIAASTGVPGLAVIGAGFMNEVLEEREKINGSKVEKA